MNIRRDARNTIIGRAFGIGAALAYGISSVFIKQGVTGLAPPLVGAAVALLFGSLVLIIIRLRDFGSVNLVRNRKAIGFFLIAGVMASLGVTTSFFALSMSPVIIVSPLMSISPLFTLLWSYLFLGKLEKVTPKLVLGSVLVVIGVVLVVIGRET